VEQPSTSVDRLKELEVFGLVGARPLVHQFAGLGMNGGDNVIDQRLRTG
jgi:hypothetical protein